MIVWARIHSTPVLQLVFDVQAEEFLDAKQARHELLQDAGTLQTSSAGLNAIVTLTLKQGTTGQSSQLLAADPPLGALVELFNADAEQFEGTLTSITLAADNCQIQVQA